MSEVNKTGSILCLVEAEEPCSDDLCEFVLPEKSSV